MCFHGQPQGLSLRFFSICSGRCPHRPKWTFTLFAHCELVRRGRRTLRIYCEFVRFQAATVGDGSPVPHKTGMLYLCFPGTPRTAFPTKNRYFSTDSAFQADGRSKPPPYLEPITFHLFTLHLNKSVIGEAYPLFSKNGRPHRVAPTVTCRRRTSFFICFHAGERSSPLPCCR